MPRRGLPAVRFVPTAFISCRFHNGLWEFVSGYPILIGCLLYGEGANLVEFDVWDYCELELYLTAMTSAFAYIYMYPKARLVMGDRCLMQSGANVLARDGSDVRVSNLAVFDASIATFTLQDFATFNADTYVYGTGNATEVVSLGSSCRATYGNKALLVSLGNAVLFRGYAAQTWAALPTIKTAAAADTQSTFVQTV